MQPKIYSPDDHHIRDRHLDPDALTILSKLREAGHTAYLVGGGSGNGEVDGEIGEIGVNGGVGGGSMSLSSQYEHASSSSSSSSEY